MGNADIYIYIHIYIYILYIYICGFLPKCLFPKMILSHVLMGARCLFYSFAISGSYWMENSLKNMYDVVLYVYVYILDIL